MAKKYIFNPFTGQLDITQDPSEAITHSELSDMPDTGGTNTDHDTRYVVKSAFTSGSVLFSDGSSITEDNSNLFWDDANNRLKIGEGGIEFSYSSTPSSNPTVGLYRSGNDLWFVIQDGDDITFRTNPSRIDMFRYDGANNKVRIGEGTTGVKIFEELDCDTSAIFNESGADKDFRIEGDTEQNLFFVDASTDRVGIGTNAPAASLHVVGGFRVYDTTNTNRKLQITDTIIDFNTDNLGTLDLRVRGLTTNNMIYGDASAGSVGIGTSTPQNTLSVLGSSGKGLAIQDSANNVRTLFDINTAGAGRFYIYDENGNSLINFVAGGAGYFKGSTIRFYKEAAGTTEMFKIDPDNNEVVVNEGGNLIDFRVEGDTESNLFFVDASADKVGIGTNTPDTLLNVNSIDEAAVKTETTINSNLNAFFWNYQIKVTDAQTNSRYPVNPFLVSYEHTSTNNPTSNWYNRDLFYTLIDLSGSSSKVNAWRLFPVTLRYRSIGDYVFNEKLSFFIATASSLAAGTGKVTIPELTLFEAMNFGGSGSGTWDVTDWTGLRIKDLVYNENQPGYVAGSRTNVFGIIIDKQGDTGATNVGGIWLNGDGVGADLVLGAGKDVSFRYSGTNTELVNLVGSGNFDVQMDLSLTAQNIITDTTTGTKIGTATTQKLGFFNATPIAQPSSTGQTAGFTAGTGTSVNDDSTFTGGVGATAYTIGDIVKHLKNLGLIAS
jgi:hypothetical protein